MKVFIFSDTKWSMGRVYTDVIRHLGPGYETRITDWACYDWQTFMNDYAWCDVCITNLMSVNLFRQYLGDSGLSKTIFLTHGFEEGGCEDTSLTYGITSDCLRHVFPENAKVHLMPNGVDHTQFSFVQRDGTIRSVGWCGAPRVWWKQFTWAEEIAKGADLPLSVAANPPFTTPAEWMPMSYDEVRQWYTTIDVLLITSVPEARIETGPLPAFEAIVSGVLVLGTPVGNFRHVPGPKIHSVEEGIQLLKSLVPEEVRRIAAEQYDYVLKNFTYSVLIDSWRKAIARRRVLVYNKLDWSVARVFRDVEKALGRQYEFTYFDWGQTTPDFYETLNTYDVILTTLPAYNILKYTDLSKCVFVCHGYPEFGDVPDLPNNLRVAATSPTILSMFPAGSTVLITPNGVDPAFFPTRRPFPTTIGMLGWVGREDPSSGGHKRSAWVREIAEKMGVQHTFAENVAFHGMNAWYNGIDVLLITAGDEPWRETGPLPAYEAIVSGVPVIGTRVGNFSNIPGPKFETIDEAVEVLRALTSDELARICEEQYAYVIKHHTYEVMADAWRACLR